MACVSEYRLAASCFSRRMDCAALQSWKTIIAQHVTSLTPATTSPIRHDRFECDFHCAPFILCCKGCLMLGGSALNRVPAAHTQLIASRGHRLWEGLGMKFGRKLRFLQVFVWGEGYLRYKRECFNCTGARGLSRWRPHVTGYGW